jgi:aminoglycoside phosphotransferase family enzyme/predicted kinase
LPGALTTDDGAVNDELGAFGCSVDLTARSAAIAETHVSVVVFVGDRAYKLKKPVRTAFLDYSTRAAREAICHREVELNRRLAPDVYLGVVDLVGPGGDVIDHLVAMRRMPDERRLATLVREGRATASVIRDVAREMAAFHGRGERRPDIDAAAAPDAVRRLWVDNFREMTGFTRSLLSPNTLGLIEGLALNYLDGRSALFEERIGRGRIVDGQGDLLAADIFCVDDGPRILDCLEFDDRLRYGDVLLDIAFLAMDLEQLGRPNLARVFLDAYREYTAETHPRSLEHHYIAYRALVRSKVACLVAESGDPTAAATASTLLDLSARHLYQARVRIVVIGGPPGTGKSTLADELGRWLGWTVVRSDEVRKEAAGLRPTDRAVAVYGEGLYTPAATETTYGELLRRAEVATSMGESVVLDASWVSAAQRDRARCLARSTHSELVELCCQCPADVATARLTRRLTRATDASDATPDVAGQIRARFDPWPSAHPIHTTGTVHASLVDALRWLGEAPRLDVDDPVAHV